MDSLGSECLGRLQLGADVSSSPGWTGLENVHPSSLSSSQAAGTELASLCLGFPRGQFITWGMLLPLRDPGKHFFVSRTLSLEVNLMLTPKHSTLNLESGAWVSGWSHFLLTISKSHFSVYSILDKFYFCVFKFTNILSSGITCHLIPHCIFHETL